MLLQQFKYTVSLDGTPTGTFTALTFRVFLIATARTFTVLVAAAGAFTAGTFTVFFLVAATGTFTARAFAALTFLVAATRAFAVAQHVAGAQRRHRERARQRISAGNVAAVSYTHLTLPTTIELWRSRGWAGD